MILTPASLQRPALAGTVVRPLLRGGLPAPTRSVLPARPILQTPVRVPQQLCLDLQPHPR
ncbi:MAG: hypothetical protein ACRC4O_08975 [Giesbergeria sp.]